MQRNRKDNNRIEELDQELAAEEQLAQLKKSKQKTVNDLMSQRDALMVQQMVAQEQGKQVKDYQATFDRLSKEIKAEEEKSLQTYAQEHKIQFGLIQKRLSVVPAKEAKGGQRAQPLRKFTEAEVQVINDHYEKLPAHLKGLMDAVLRDEHNDFNLMTEPVFFAPDGHIFDKSFLLEWLAKGHKTSPRGDNIPYTEKDLTPCNSLIKAMSQLLIIIQDENKVDVEEVTEYAVMDKKIDRKIIDENLIPLVQATYQKMPPKHRALFNILCRDPVYGIIIDNPVLLPDGYVYDRAGAEYLLKRRGGKCHYNPNIVFTEEHLKTKCYFVVDVLKQLGAKAEATNTQPSAPELPFSAVGVNFHDKEDEASLLEKERVALEQQIDQLQKRLELVKGKQQALRVKSFVNGSA